LICAAALLLFSCTSAEQQKQKEIVKLETELKQEFREDAARKLVKEYEAYFTKYPESKESKEYLFRAANTLVSLREGKRAIAYFDQYMSKYPDDKNTPVCLFTKALTYDTALGDKASAVAAYQEFISRYPEHEFADDAQNALLLLQDPLELIRSFEARQDTVQP